MDELTALTDAGAWDEATSKATAIGVPISYVAQLHFLSLNTETLDAQLVHSLLDIIEDKDWVASAALRTIHDSEKVDVARAAVVAGLDATQKASEKHARLHQLLNNVDREQFNNQLKSLFETDEAALKICLVRKALLDASDRMATWEELWSEAPEVEDGKGVVDMEKVDATVTVKDWEVDQIPSSRSILEDASIPATRLSLPIFLHEPLADTAVLLAASGELEKLNVLCYRHFLWPFRFDILASISEWKEPKEYLDLLPRIGEDGKEQRWQSKPWRPKGDWVENATTLYEENEEGQMTRLDSEELSIYYEEWINRMSAIGLVANALSLVQHGVSLGIPGLESVGEELSLLAKLVYERPKPVQHPGNSDTFDDNLSLEHWRTLSAPQVVRAYMTFSTPDTISNDVRRLVLPYLSVLEMRLERAGAPDPALTRRLLYNYILELATLNRLDLLQSIFETSKPTLPSKQRLISSDEDLARLALSCLYGNTDTSSDALGIMTKIFECLPAFSEVGAELTPQLFKLFPTSTPLAEITPTVLYEKFQKSGPSSLTFALDALDLQLATAEIFSRYSVAVPLSWFLISYHDQKAQRAWATRMARTSATGGGGRSGNEAEFESEDEWEALMEDMVALVEGDEVEEGDDHSLNQAFWLLSREEVLRIFFGGLLAAGKFSMARSLFQPSSTRMLLEPKVIEELVITASHEFYDNAESGNINESDMRNAIECLSAAPQTPAIRKERDFIEATSRLCSFKIYSHPGIPVAPIEIRLSKDRLEYISRLLASNEDAHRHPNVILDLVEGLGYKGDKLAEIRTLAMINDSSVQAGDCDRAADTCDRMVILVEGLRSSKSPIAIDAGEYAWRSCFQLGKHEAFQNLERRMLCLGQALILCPADRIANLLPVWTDLELRLLQEKSIRGRDGVGSDVSKFNSSVPTAPTNKSTRKTGPALSSETAAAAHRTLKSAAAFFPFGGSKERSSQQPSAGSGYHGDFENDQNRIGGFARGSGGNTREKEHGFRGEEGLRAGLSSRLTAGVGWLIGADEALERGN